MFDGENTPMMGSPGFAVDRSSVEKNGNEMTIKVFSLGPVPFPGELEIDGKQWIFSGNGFLTIEESNMFFAKAIYKHKIIQRRPIGNPFGI
jgi:hypothetical protein